MSQGLKTENRQLKDALEASQQNVDILARTLAQRDRELVAANTSLESSRKQRAILTDVVRRLECALLMEQSRPWARLRNWFLRKAGKE